MNTAAESRELQAVPDNEKGAYDSLRKIAEEQRQQIELMLRQLPGGMQTRYPDENFTTKWISSSLLSLLGYPDLNKFMQRAGGFRAVILPEDLPRVQEALSRLPPQGAAQECPFQLEYRARRMDGSIIWLLEIGKRCIDADGEDVLHSFLTDISERVAREIRLRHAHQELESQANFLRQLYHTVPCGIIQFSTQNPYQILYANRMAWEIYGFSKEEYWSEPRSVFYSVGEKDRQWMQDIVMRTIQEGGQTKYEREAIRKDGSKCYIVVYMERLTNADGLDVVQAIFNDITEFHRLQKEQEQEQLKENQFLRTAIHTAYQRIARCNLNTGAYTCFLDQNFIDRTGYASDYDTLFEQTKEKIAPSMLENYTSEMSRQVLLRKFQAGEKEAYLELQRRGEDGVYHWVSMHAIRASEPLAAPDGQTQDIEIIMLSRVLDEQQAEKKRQEEILRDALAGAEAANLAKSDFLSRMSHDIRTPMNAIIGMSLLGQERIDKKEAVLDCFHKIDSSAQYLLSLINDILDMSRIESGKMVIGQSEFKLEDLLSRINDIIAPQAEDRQLTYQVSWTPSGETYLGDELRINQILMNLLSNSLKFTPAGGRIYFQIRRRQLRGSSAGLEFLISDTGIGMSREFLSRLGQPFEQENPGVARNNSGSGLGLSIVCNLVQLMGGAIEIDSEKGCGSRFTVFVPVLLAREAAAVSTAGPGPSSGAVFAAGADSSSGAVFAAGADSSSGAVFTAGPDSSSGAVFTAGSDSSAAGNTPRPHIPGRGTQTGKRLLLVEDNELNLEIAQALLEMSGYAVDTAQDGAEAVHKIELREARYYDAVLMDIRMPVMDGLEATRRIRMLREKQGDRLPIIAMSANAFEEDKARARKAGVDDYVVKPIDMHLLQGTLERLLHS